MKHYPYRRNSGCRLMLDQSWCGYHAVTLQNRWLRVTVLPEKGGDIVEFLHKPSDTDLMFLAPNGLRRAEHAEPTLGTAPGAFMDRYPGAWQEILPAGGPPAAFGGIDFGQHGEISVLPWRCELLRDEPGEVAVRLTVQTIRTPFLLERTMRLSADAAALVLEERITNLAPQPLPLMWGHHPALGGGFLDESCRIELAAARVEVPAAEAFATQRLAPGYQGDWPHARSRDGVCIDLSRMPAPGARTADFFFLTGLGEGRYRVVSERLKLAFELTWDLAVMPHLWFWQVARGAENYPWWGQTYNLALEPFTSRVASYPEAAARGDALLLAGHASRQFQLVAALQPVD